MAPESEKLLEGREFSSPTRFSRSDQSSRIRRYRLIGALTLVCVIIYILTSTILLEDGSQNHFAVFNTARKFIKTTLNKSELSNQIETAKNASKKPQNFTTDYNQSDKSESLGSNPRADKMDSAMPITAISTPETTEVEEATAAIEVKEETTEASKVEEETSEAREVKEETTETSEIDEETTEATEVEEETTKSADVGETTDTTEVEETTATTKVEETTDTTEVEETTDTTEVEETTNTTEVEETTNTTEVEETTDTTEVEETTDTTEVEETTDTTEVEETTNTTEVEETTEAKEGEETTEAKEGEETTEAKEGEETTEAKEGEETTEAKEGEEISSSDNSSKETELKSQTEETSEKEDREMSTENTLLSETVNTAIKYNNLSTFPQSNASITENNKGENKNDDVEPYCKVPKLDPFDPSIRHLINIPQKPKCLKQFHLIFETGVDNIITQINHPSSFNWTNCGYRIIFRKNHTGARDPDNSETYSSEFYPMTKNKMVIPSEHEFIAVYCIPTNESTRDKKKLKMVDTFAFANLKPKVEQRIKDFEKDKIDEAKSKVNLVVLGLDAVSHMNFQRLMPQVYKYLITNLSGIGMDGYSKIGDNTLPNIGAVLTSWNKTEIIKRCQKSAFFDDCPFIWKNFSKQGYRTSYGEDAPWMGIFNYIRNGFRKPPVDYYLRPFSRASESKIGNDRRGNAKICYGPRPSFKVLLNYMQKMAKTMGYTRRYFQFIWATALTHDYLNLGRLGEDNLLSTLKWFQNGGYLNNTVFILMSDHGMRFGEIRRLPQGKVEENMPFIYFVFPKWFKLKYKSAIKNLINNKDRLTSAFDTHETFKDILFLDRIENGKIFDRTKKLKTLEGGNRLPRGISMFLPVPKTRSCAMAEIPEHWCICHTSESLSTDSSIVEQAANYAVYSLNALIANYTKCAYLALASVTQAKLIHTEHDPSKLNKTEKVFELAFQTEPGKGTFDATVVKKRSGKWKMSGSISRTNLYGNQSYCVGEKEMKKYCYCLESELR